MTHDASGAELTLDNISKHYGSVVAADGVTIDVKPGEFVSFLGPSGSGKTTTLNMIAGFEDPSSGRILINGSVVTGIPIHKRNIGMVFQGYALFPHMSVEKNIEYPLKQHGYTKHDREAAVVRALETVDLTQYRKRMPGQLSGGQRQRVALARAIAYDPPLLLMDEPLSALDKALRESLQAEIRRIHRELGTTVIYVTHDQDEALALSDRIVVFNKGRIQQVGSPAELYSSPANEFVSRFLGESIHLTGDVVQDGPNTTFVMGNQSWAVDTEHRGAAQLMIRPESVSVVRGSESVSGDVPLVSAQVTDTVFIGHSIKYTVESAHGGGVVRSSIHQDPGVGIGDEVFLTWDPADSCVLGGPVASTFDKDGQ